MNSTFGILGDQGQLMGARGKKKSARRKVHESLQGRVKELDSFARPCKLWCNLWSRRFFFRAPRLTAPGSPRMLQNQPKFK